MGGPRDEGTLNTVLVGSPTAVLVRREGYYRLAARADTHRRTAAQKGGVVANRNPSCRRGEKSVNSNIPLKNVRLLPFFYYLCTGNCHAAATVGKRTASQIRSLGSWFLYQINQGRIANGEAIDEQLARLGLKPSIPMFSRT